QGRLAVCSCCCYRARPCPRREIGIGMKPAKKPKTRKAPGSTKPRAKVEAKAAPPDRPITKLIAEAEAVGERCVQLPRSELTEGDRVVVRYSLLLEAAPGSLLPPILRLKGLGVTGGKKLTLRHVSLKQGGMGDCLIDVGPGAHLELIDCHLEGGGIKLRTDASATLVRTCVHGSRSYGISGCEFRDLQIRECQITHCEGEGIHCTSGKAFSMSDSRIAKSTLSGILVDGRPGETSLSSCTLSDNGQFGIWVDSGCRVSGVRNSLAGNSLGETGGRGETAKNLTVTFSVGDACSVWCEEKAVWLPGMVTKVLQDCWVVRAELPSKLEVRTETAPQRKRQKGPDASSEVKQTEIRARQDSIRLPSGGDEPPSWSKKLKTYKRRQNAFNLFLRDGGRSTSAWKALDVKEKAKYQLKARKVDKEQKQKADKPQTIIQANQLVKSIAKHKKGLSKIED
ncbi:unnamed protein product, partial [Effrenium voratum]